MVLSPLVRCQGVFLWVPSEGAVDGTQKAKTELDWDNLPMERWMNDEFQRLLRANEDVQTVISGALRTIEETQELLDLVSALSSPLIKSEPPLRDRPKSD